MALCRKLLMKSCDICLKMLVLMSYSAVIFSQIINPPEFRKNADSDIMPMENMKLNLGLLKMMNSIF